MCGNLRRTVPIAGALHRDPMTVAHHLAKRWTSAAIAALIALGAASNALAHPTSRNDALALGTNMRFSRLGLEEGLAQSSVSSILQDRQGYIWMGTEDGLHRYDGYSFRIFRNDPEDPGSISESQIYALHEDRAGNIWVGTLNGGLNRFDPIAGTFSHFRAGRAADTLSHDTVYTILEDRSGSIWVGTERGLNRLDPATGKVMRYLAGQPGGEGLRHSMIWALHEDPKGRIWVGTNDGVSRFDPRTGRFEDLKLAGGKVEFDKVSVNAIGTDPEGRTWVANSSGVAVFGDQDRRVAEYPGDKAGGQIGTGRVRNLLFGRAGEIWLAVYRTGLVELDPKTGRVMTFKHDPADRSSLGDDNVQVLLEDRSGVLWVGTEAAGVSRFNPATRRFLHYRNQPGEERALLDHMVWSVLPARDGTLWVGQQTGLTHIDRRKGSYQHFKADRSKLSEKSKQWKVPGKLRGEWISSLHEADDGRLWVGTERGLHWTRDGGARFELIDLPGEDEEQHFYANNISSILPDGPGAFWLGTALGLVHYQIADGSSRRFRADQDDLHTIPGDYILALGRSRDGTLWVCTERGVAYLAPGTEEFVRLPVDGEQRSRHLSNQYVQAVIEDPEGTMWFGTSDGLDRYDRRSGDFEHFGVEQGLPNDTVYTLLLADDGGLWMSTNRGLARFDRISHAVRTWLVEDGLQSNEFNGGAAARSASGELFFGGVNGLNAFDPSNLVEQDVAPTVAITGVELVNQRLDMVGELARERHLVLDHTEPVLGFQFAVFDFAAPTKNRFLYQLEGFDPDWRDGQARAGVTYTNLDPGEYLFRVKGANTHGVWSTEDATLTITVLPPPWRTWWAYAGYVLLALALVISIARAHHFKVKRDHELQAEQAKRRWSETLHQLSQSLAASLDAHQIAELLMDSLRRMVNFRSAALFVEQGVDVQLVGTRGFPEELSRALRNLPEQRARLFAECRHRREPMPLSGEDMAGTAFAGEPGKPVYLLAIPTFSRAEEFALLLIARSDGPYTAQEQEIAAAVARQALVALDNARLFAELQNLATTDNLTKVNNRRYFFELAELEFARGRRYGRNLAVILLDADGFTSINETYGHEVGDRVLRLIASTCRANLRHFDIIGRYGGEDFVIMLPETALNVAADVADRLRKAVDSMVVETHSGELRVTVSLGVAVATPEVPDLATLINRADMALYEAKRSGRNRVVVAEQH
jgi:diguanylate cyclase (GGDEF)-like protein